MDDPEPACRTSGAATTCARPSLNGIDYVEVGDDQRDAARVLPRQGAARTSSKANVAHRRRPPHPRHRGRPAVRVAAAAGSRRSTTVSRSRVDKPGDFSTYTLRLVEPTSTGARPTEPLDGFDPRYAAVDFCFKAGCPTDLDCKPRARLPAAATARAPEINYLAKDYASFRQLILDRLALIMPDWTERHVARPRDHAGRAARLRRRLPQLLPGRGRDRGLSRHRAAADLGAPARAAGRLPDARRLQRARLADHQRPTSTQQLDPTADLLLHRRFPARPVTARARARRSGRSVGASSYEVFEPLVTDRRARRSPSGRAQRDLASTPGATASAAWRRAPPAATLTDELGRGNRTPSTASGRRPRTRSTPPTQRDALYPANATRYAECCASRRHADLRRSARPKTGQPPMPIRRIARPCG